MVRHVPGLDKSTVGMKGGGWDERSDSERDRESGVPFMLMLSPKWASVRISAQSEIVSEVPPPPAAVSSCFSRRVTAGCVSLAEKETGWRKGETYCL